MPPAYFVLGLLKPGEDPLRAQMMTSRPFATLKEATAYAATCDAKYEAFVVRRLVALQPAT